MLRSLDTGFTKRYFNEGFWLPEWEVDEASFSPENSQIPQTFQPPSKPNLETSSRAASSQPSGLVIHRDSLRPRPPPPAVNGNIYPRNPSDPIPIPNYSTAVSSHISTPVSRLRRVAKTRLGLPITFDPHGVAATVLACPDTGAEVNVISGELARILGYTVCEPCPSESHLMLANGKTLKALGLLKIPCCFGMESHPTSILTCIFYVLLEVISPVIMGMDFLHDTRTMTEYRSRLVRVPRSPSQTLSVRSVGRPRRRMSCEISGNSVWAFPDSGSDVNLISSSFASALGLSIEAGQDVLQLADGSIVKTSGITCVSLSIDSESASHFRTLAYVEFLVLDTFHHSLIVGIDTLETLGVFTHNSHAFTSDHNSFGPSEVNRIRYLGTIDDVKAWIKRLIRGKPTLPLLPNERAPTALNDQRENDRREKEIARIAELPDCERDAAIALEARKQSVHKMYSAANENIIIDEFKCEHAGCNAGSFFTRYLLDVHVAQCHKSRQHYCIFSTCSRSEGGMGFRLAFQLESHLSSVHSGIYKCPFCACDCDGAMKMYRHVKKSHSEQLGDNFQLPSPRINDVNNETDNGRARKRPRHN